MFRLGLVRPHYFTPGRGTTTTLPAACPYIPTLYFAATASLVRSFLRSSLYLSLVPSCPLLVPLSPSFPRIIPCAAQSLSNFHPVRFATSFLYRSRNDTIGLSLSSRARKLSPRRALAHTHVYTLSCVGTSDTYRYGLPFTVDYIRNLTGGPVHFRNYCINF